MASQQGKLEVVEWLECKGASINQPTNDGRTPLFSSSEKGYTEVVKFLLDAGADINTANKVFSNFHFILCSFIHSCLFRQQIGKTPLAVAIERGHQKVVDLLESWPRVVPLRTLCLRVIRVKSNEVAVPAWVPPVLLEWPSIEEIQQASSSSMERNRKRKRE